MSNFNKEKKSDIPINEIINSYQKNNDLKKTFFELILNLSTKEILWPEKHIEKFPKPYQIFYNDNIYIAYLFRDIDKIEALEYKIQEWLQHQIGYYEHPYIIFYYLQVFYEGIKESFIDQSIKNATREVLDQIKLKTHKNIKTRKKYQEKNIPLKSDKNQPDPNYDYLEKKIRKLKKVLNVPKKWMQLKSEEIFNELLLLFQELSLEKHALEKEKINLEIELEHFKSPDYINPDLKKQLDELKQQISQLNKDLLQERSKNDILEKEVKRLTEQIIENPTIMNQQEELENLKREYTLLSEKYDLLVSKNIELRNLLERQSHVKTLQDALNKVRDRINKILRTGGINEEVMIIKIKQEIEELQRARVYLGKALYDLGLLYLRLGKKEDALRELRAARELGIEDPEVNRILNSGN